MLTMMDVLKRHTYRDGDVATLPEIYAANTVSPREVEELRDRQRVAEAARRDQMRRDAAAAAKVARHDAMAAEWEASHGR